MSAQAEQAIGNILTPPSENRTPQEIIPTLAKITVVVDRELNVQAQTEGHCSLSVVTMALETAKAMLVAQLLAAMQQPNLPRILQAPPGMRF